MSEVHISSLILHAQAKHVSMLETEVKGYPYAELEVSDESQGKLIVILETPTMRELKDSISYFEQLDGVLTAAMVYHHVEAPSSLNEVIA